MNSTKKFLKQRSGITLIALVITIIVLLILAGVTIATLTGENGLLQRATDAKQAEERESIIEQAKTDVFGYQVDNKGEYLDKTQLKSVLDTYFKNVPDLTDMSDREIKEKQLDTLEKYGTHSIAVSEIYNGNIKSSNTQTMISFSIKVQDDGKDKGTFNFSCVQGATWYQWASTSSDPLYVNTAYKTCGYFEGSLQELILSDTNQEKGIWDESSYCQLARNDTGSWIVAKRGDEIVENITYILDFYED